MSANLGVSWVVIVLMLALPALVAGVFLLRKGWSPPRQGLEPHCRACDYLLIGNQSARCPECGTQLSPENIVLGQRNRRPAVVIAGALLGLISLVIILPVGFFAVREIEWYHFAPAFWVMKDLRSTSATTMDQAMDELLRRDADGDLSAKYEQQLIEMALVHQGLTTTAPVTSNLVQFAGRKYRDGTMSDAQKLRFNQQCMQLGLQIRPAVLLGDEVPYQVTESARIGSELFWVNSRARLIRIDGKTVREWIGDQGGSSSMSGLGSGGSGGGSVPCKVPGKHLLEVTTHIQLYSGPFGHTDKAILLFQQDIKVQGEFLVLADAPPGYFTTNADPAMAQQLMAAMKPRDFKIEHAGQPYLNGMIQVTSSPADIAFNVFTRVNGREYSLGTIACGKGKSCGYGVSGSFDHFAMNPPPTGGDLILRSSEKAARQTIDLYGCWKGELVFPAVPFAMSKH